MKTLTLKKLSVISLSVAMAFSGSLLADDKKQKHYGDDGFNGSYHERHQDYNDNRSGRYSDYRDDHYGRDYHSNRYPVYSKIKRARVIDVDPVYRNGRVQPSSYEQCWDEPRRVSRSDRRAGSLLGAVVGGVIGYKVGGKHRHNRRSGAAVGAVLGSALGKNVASNKHRNSRHCETVYSRDDYGSRDIVGYNVTYKYKGKRFETFTNYRPGRYIDLRVTAEPVLR